MVIETDAAGTVRVARIAVGACSAVAQRVAERHLAPLPPIDDLRGSAEYRRDAVLTLIRRALIQLAERPA